MIYTVARRRGRIYRAPAAGDADRWEHVFAAAFADHLSRILAFDGVVPESPGDD